MESKESWIIDTDCGVDDAQAIFLAIKYLNVVAITTVTGNCSAANAAVNTSIILGSKGKDIPIYIGQECPMVI